MGVLPVTCMAHEAVIFTAALEVVATFAPQLQPHLLCWFLMICNQSDRGLDRTLIKTTELWHITNKRIYLYIYIFCSYFVYRFYLSVTPLAALLCKFPICRKNKGLSYSYLWCWPQTEHKNSHWAFSSFLLKWNMIGSLILSKSFVTHYTPVKNTRCCLFLSNARDCLKGLFAKGILQEILHPLCRY